jgi:hypothetical protein
MADANQVGTHVHAQDKQPDEQTGDKHRVTADTAGHAEVPAFGPMTPSAVTALQRSAGNRVVARMLAETRDSADPSVQRGLVDAALRSSGRQIESARRAKLESFHQTDLSSVRVHTGPLAQRSADAIGASAFTVGTDIVLSADADDDETLGHEVRHVEQQRAGRVAGTDNGAGLAVSDPGHREEREAAADGAAFLRGADQAPSLAAEGAGGSHAPSSSAPAVQRVSKDDQSGEENDDDDQGEEQQDGKGKKVRKTQKQLLKEITDEVHEHTLAHGGGRHGRVTKGEVRLRFARDKKSKRSEQTLSHLSMLLHDTIRAVQKELIEANPETVRLDDREVQGMLINDRLLFASNFNESIERLREKFGEKLASLRQMLGTQQSNEDRGESLFPADANEYIDRLERAAEKVNAAFDGARGTNDDNTADAMRRAVNRPVTIVDADDPDMRQLLTDPRHAGSVMLIRYGKTNRKKRKGDGETPASMHAEQKLLLALHKAGLTPKQATNTIVISGKYRPCVGCAAALRYYRDAGFSGLQFNENHGHYYLDSVRGLERHLRHVVEDPHYLEHIRRMLDPRHGDAVSTSALSHQAPPDDADDNNGREIRIPPDESRGRGYVTASDSEVEDTDDGGRRSTKRDLMEYVPEAGGRKIGPGKQKVNAGRRAAQVLTPMDEARLRSVWKTGTPDEQIALFREYANRRRLPASATEIAKASGAPEGTVRNYIKGATGHKRGSTADPKRKTQRAVDPDGLAEFERAIGNHPFRDQLRQARASDSVLKPSQMPRSLSEKIAELWGTYSMPSIASELRMKETSLKNHLKPFRAARAESADAEMADVADEEAEGYGGDIEMDEPREMPDFPGYVVRVDPAGQAFYVNTSTNGRYFFDGTTLRPLVDEEDPRPRRAGESSRQAEASSSASESEYESEYESEEADSDAMDIVEEDEEEEEEYLPAPHGKGVPRRGRP